MIHDDTLTTRQKSEIEYFRGFLKCVEVVLKLDNPELAENLLDIFYEETPSYVQEALEETLQDVTIAAHELVDRPSIYRESD